MRFALTLLSLAATAAIAQTTPTAPSADTTAEAASPSPSSQAIRPEWQTRAQATAAQGIPVEMLAKGAPARYTVQRGDTLWALAALYLNEPWLWPELWGANRAHIANPHRIYPGQELVLIRSATHARLARDGAEGMDPLDPNHPNAQFAPGDAPVMRNGEPPTVRLSPKVRAQPVGADAIPTLKMHLIEPFLTDPLVADTNTFEHAPRIVAGHGNRQLLGPGDTLYAIADVPKAGDATAVAAYTPLAQSTARQWRIMRPGQAITDPATGEILGWQADYVGRAELFIDQPAPVAEDAPVRPAELRIVRMHQEITPGDRLLPEPPRPFQNFAPHAPSIPVAAQVVQVHGGLQGAAHTVIAINRGRADGVHAGMVLALMSDGMNVADKKGADDKARIVQLPPMGNGHAMVFRTFDRVSYALILDSQRDVRRGDRLINP